MLLLETLKSLELELVTISNFRKIMQKTLIFIGVFCILLSCSYGQDSSIITIQQGKLKGLEHDDGTIKYFGIPYAKAPVGNLRWKEPLPHEGWEGTFLGRPMPQTDYWFRVFLEDGREFKGHFSLVRRK